MAGDTDSSRTNRQHLIERFAARLLALQPRSVLDVGCGDGALMARLRAAGVQVTGIEPSAAKLVALRARGLRVISGSAERLPCPRGAFDWLALRHVAHHFRDPRAALREAARVTRRGLLIAEPWRDLEYPEQVTASAVDRYAKRQDRRLGRVHHEDHSGDELVDLLPDREEWVIEIETYQARGFAARGEVRDELTRSVADLPPSAADHAELGQLLARAEQTGVGLTGTVLVKAVRRRFSDASS